MEAQSITEMKNLFTNFNKKDINLELASKLSFLIEDKPEIFKSNFEKEELIHTYTRLAAFFLDLGIQKQD